ncbi:MAG: prepilin-type N-terminal cleavage/methylation domain-containing protein [Planctomycetota bacterium]
MKKNQQGFTLIEIMVVVVIIGLLAAFVGPEVFQLFASGQEDIAAAKCKDIYNKVGLWKMTKKTGVPDSLDELEAPLRKSQDEPFMVMEPDPWGEDYRIVKLSRSKYRICSNGPDMEPDTDDDICYPEDKE